MPPLHSFIQSALAQRHTQVPRLERAQKDLGKLGDVLGRLSELAQEAAAPAAAPRELQDLASTLSASLGNLKSRVTDQQAKIANLLVRFGKNTINIGVAGKARQGKSTLLQQISGLDDVVIPSSSGLPCTGAKSKILHQEQDPHAVIEFYTEEEFLKGIVHAYYDELGLPHPPASLNEFNKPLPALPSNVPEKHAIYQKLVQLHDGLASFAKYLSRPPGRIGLDRVRELVAQDGARKLYLAVKCANIFAPFPKKDVKGLAIIDLPGLGEVALGHGQKLVASLRREVDVVLLLKLPSAEGDHWDQLDYEVFNRVKQAVPEIELTDWLFPVLNATGHNSHLIKLLQDQPPDVGSKLQVLAANCRSADEVDRQVFAVVLNHLQMNLERIDKAYLAGLIGELALLSQDVAEAIEPLRQFFQTDNVGMQDALRFNGLCRDFLKELRQSLELLVEDFRKKRKPETQGGIWAWWSKGVPADAQVSVDAFQLAVQEACAKSEEAPVLPPVDELRRNFFDKGGWNAVIQDELHHLRSDLTQRLAEAMDKQLVQMADDARREMLLRLLAPPLDKLLPEESRNGADALERVKDFRQLVDEKAHQKLAKGLDYLLSFDFSYHSHFHYRVREAMNSLDPMSPECNVVPSKQNADAADEVASRLKEQNRKVIAKVRGALQSDIRYDPLRAVFAMLEETRDRLVRANGVEEEWNKLLYLHRAEVWPGEFNPFGVAAARRQQWQKVLEQAHQHADQLRTML
jgi:hypothetical protein